MSHGVKGHHLSRTRPGRVVVQSPTQHGTGGRSRLKGSKRYRVLDSVTGWPAWTWSMLDRIAGPCGTGSCHRSSPDGTSRAPQRTAQPTVRTHAGGLPRAGTLNEHNGEPRSCGHPEEWPTQESSGWALAPKGARSARPDDVCNDASGICVNVQSREARPAGAVRERSSRSAPITQPAPASGPKKEVAGATTVALVGFALWAKGAKHTNLGVAHAPSQTTGAAFDGTEVSRGASPSRTLPGRSDRQPWSDSIRMLEDEARRGSARRQRPRGPPPSR